VQGYDGIESAEEPVRVIAQGRGCDPDRGEPMLGVASIGLDGGLPTVLAGGVKTVVVAHGMDEDDDPVVGQVGVRHADEAPIGRAQAVIEEGPELLTFIAEDRSQDGLRHRPVAGAEVGQSSADPGGAVAGCVGEFGRQSGNRRQSTLERRDGERPKGGAVALPRASGVHERSFGRGDHEPVRSASAGWTRGAECHGVGAGSASLVVGYEKANRAGRRREFESDER